MRRGEGGRDDSLTQRDCARGWWCLVAATVANTSANPFAVTLVTFDTIHPMQCGD